MTGGKELTFKSRVHHKSDCEALAPQEPNGSHGGASSTVHTRVFNLPFDEEALL